MKKITIFVAIIVFLSGMNTSAQVPILPHDTNLYYDWWWYDDLISDTAQGLFVNEIEGVHTGDSGSYSCIYPVCLGKWFEGDSQHINCGELAKYFYTDTALSILGIGVCPGLTGAYFEEKYSYDTMVLSDSFLSLYKKDGDDMLLLGRKHMGHDTLSFYRNWLYTTTRWRDSRDLSNCSTFYIIIKCV